MAQEYGKFDIIFRAIILGLFRGGLEKKNIGKILQKTYNNKYVDIKSLIKKLNFAINDETRNCSELNCDNGYR